MPICLPWNEEDPTVESIQKVNPNQDITITGWGKITNIRSKSFQNYQQYAVATRTLQTVKLPIQINEKFDDQPIQIWQQPIFYGFCQNVFKQI